MKKLTIGLLVIAISLPGLLGAQDRAIGTIDPVRSYDGTIVYKKVTVPAKVFEFRYPAKDLANAIGAYLEQRGGKLSKSKGLVSVSSVSLHDSDNKAYDVYYQVKGKGSGKNALSTLAVILAEPGEDILQRQMSDEAAAGGAALPAIFASVGAERFFQDLGVYVGDHDHNKLTTSSEKDLQKAQRRYDKLVSKGRSLERKIQKLERQIAENLEQQRQQAREVDLARIRLDQIKSRRR